VKYVPSTVGYEDVSEDIKMVLSRAAESHKASVTIMDIKDPNHPAYGEKGLFALSNIESCKVLGEYAGTVRWA
jgi:hypothetical protein